jgi:hypothetical protein
MARRSANGLGAMFLVAGLLAGCVGAQPAAYSDELPASTPSPTRATSATQTLSPTRPPTLAPTIPPTVAPTPANPHEALPPASWMITLVDNLRARSEPRISDDSIKYEPLLPKGTTFEIVRGPIEASGYSWYLVKLAPGVLRDGITQAWLAEGDRDGTPWIKNIPID